MVRSQMKVDTLYSFFSIFTIHVRRVFHQKIILLASISQIYQYCISCPCVNFNPLHYFDRNTREKQRCIAILAALSCIKYNARGRRVMASS